jgi:hypothetical protein
MQFLWEFLFKYPPLLFEKGRIVFASPLPGWLLALAVLLAAAAGWTYLRASGRLAPRDRAVLVAMRASLLALLLLALLRPTLQVPVSVPQENYLGILIDDSRSMQIADGDAGPRGEQLRGVLDEQLLSALQDRFRLRVFRFSGAVDRIDGAGDLTFAGGQTRIGQALDQRPRRARGRAARRSGPRHRRRRPGGGGAERRAARCGPARSRCTRWAWGARASRATWRCGG